MVREVNNGDDSKREQTDDALDVERSKTDKELTSRRAVIQEDADQVVEDARTRADAVLAKARARSDDKPLDPDARAVQRRERRTEDAVVARERAAEDAGLAGERNARARMLADLLTREREHTDERLDDEREHADAAVASRDDFLGMVSHDLRTLLSGMVMSAASLLNIPAEGEVRKQVHREGRRLQRFSTRMNLLVGDLLDVVSIEAGKLRVEPSPHEANDLIRETVETFEGAAAARNIALRARVSEGSLLGEFDRERILQVLANLVSNAIKFTKDGGEISLLAEPSEKDVRFSVSDNGTGIAPEKIAKIFDRYVQGASYDRRGLGIGLYISRCIIEAHRGRIWVTSEPGQGSVFYFTLPGAAA